MDKTIAPGSYNGQFVDESALGEGGTLLTAEDLNSHQDEIYNTIMEYGGTCTRGVNNQMAKATKKWFIENKREIGEIFALAGFRQPSRWNPSNPSAYFPAICISGTAGVTEVSAAEWPDAVPVLRSIGYQSFPISYWQRVNNTIDIVFPPWHQSSINYCLALAQDQTISGTWEHWRIVTLPAIPGLFSSPGVYAITGLTNNPGQAGVKIYNAGPNVGPQNPTNLSAGFYPYQMVDPTKAQIFTGPGLTLRSAGDSNGYFFEGLRTKGRLQNVTGELAITYLWPEYASGAFTIQGASDACRVPANAGTDYHSRIAKFDLASSGARTGLETYGPSYGVNLYMHLGRNALPYLDD